eukprot:529119_1
MTEIELQQPLLTLNQQQVIADDEINLEIVSSDHKSISETFVTICKLCCSVLLWIIGMCLIILYVIAASLPSQNVLQLNTLWSKMITKCISLILIANNKFIIPLLASNVTICIKRDKFITSKIKLQFILILQLINSVFLPFIASIYFFHDCGNYWVSLWDYCGDKSDVFNVRTYNFLTDTYYTLLTEKEVCVTPSLSQMNFDQCIRSFSYNWTGVIMMKLIYGIFVQVISVICKLLKQKYLSKICTNGCWKKFFNHEINVERQQISIVLNILVSVVFCFFAPLLIPLALFDTVLRIFFFRLMHYKFKWKFVSDMFKAPTRFLFISVLLSQIITTLYIGYCIDDLLILIIFIVMIIFMDMYVLYKEMRN